MAPHMWCAGVYYPRAEDIEDNGIEGYVLTEDELATVAARLVGKPVTFEHKGIEGASAALPTNASSMEVIRSLNREARADSLRAPVGVVTNAWKTAGGEWMCAIRINAQLFPRLASLVREGVLSGLSMSHFHTDDPAPLEVSLCAEPARPGCHVRAGSRCFASPEQLKVYIADSVCVPQRATMDTSPNDSAAPAAPLTMDAVLKSMSAEHRSLISAAFADMNKKVDATEAANKEMKAKQDEIEKAAETDKKLLNHQLQTLMSQLDEDTKSRFNINFDNCRSNMVEENDPATIRRTVDRLLMCCNHTLMQRAGAGSKRKADAMQLETPAAPAEPEAPAAVFEPAAASSPSSAADQLRAALASYEA